MATTLFATTYARLTGILLLITGVFGIASLAAGYVGVLSLDFLAWDQTHNVIHLLLGAIAVYVGFAPKPYLDPIQYSKIFGIVYIGLAVVGTIFPSLLSVVGMHIEVGEDLIHFLIGGLGLLAGFYVLEPSDEDERPSYSASA